jgi:hypothetical protein
VVIFGKSIPFMGKSEASSHIRIKYFQKEEKGEEEIKVYSYKGSVNKKENLNGKRDSIFNKYGYENHECFGKV